MKLLSPTPPLTLLQMKPDMEQLSLWAGSTRQKALQTDRGYALHAAMQATLGALTPRPFALRRRTDPSTGDDYQELVGYVVAEHSDVLRAAELPPPDQLAANAVGLHTLNARKMPAAWRSGERFSFETRVAPLVRSRMARAGAIVEVDAAHHASLAGQTPGDRYAAYGAWLARELQRGDAAALDGWGMQAFALTPVARRSQAREGVAGRQLARGLLPDLTARGELVVQDSAAFTALLARGLGRHRAFGYGCLLLAPAGVLHRSPRC